MTPTEMWVGWVLWGVAVALGIAGWVLCTTAVVTALRHDGQPKLPTVLRTTTMQAGLGAFIILAGLTVRGLWGGVAAAAVVLALPSFRRLTRPGSR